MSLHPKSSSNGLARRRVDRELGVRQESKSHVGKQFSSNSTVSDHLSNRFLTPSRDRLIFTSTCLIGHLVEVHVKNGSVITGIFHATNAERDFGIVLKMAQVVKDGSLKGQIVTSDISKRPHTIIIPGNELVQVIAKDVLLIGGGTCNEPVYEKCQDLMIDSAISHSHCVERELERWTPGFDDPECPELDNIFDVKWNRKWDQFQTNETLFGVKSTFNEELYTTKLERGPQTKELEREALRIAREIEGEDTDDLHIAEERGANICKDFELDEESRFSAVQRIGDYANDGDDENKFDKHDADSFGDSVEAVSFNGTSDVKTGDQSDAETSHSAATEEQVSHSVDPEKLPPLVGQIQFMAFNAENVVGEHVNQGDREKAQSSKLGAEKQSLDTNTFSSNQETPSLCPKQSIEENRTTTGSHIADSGKTSTTHLPLNSLEQFAKGTPPVSKEDEDCRLASTSPGLSPSSSVGSMSSEKSMLNPYAKEFKLNPNAKVFKPSSSLRLHTRAAETSVYYGTNTSMPYMPGLPMGVGMGSFGGHQQPVYTTPAVNTHQSPQPYISSSPQLYGQQTMIGQPRPYVLMPAYPPEMQYRGREF